MKNSRAHRPRKRRNNGHEKVSRAIACAVQRESTCFRHRESEMYYQTIRDSFICEVYRQTTTRRGADTRELHKGRAKEREPATCIQSIKTPSAAERTMSSKTKPLGARRKNKQTSHLRAPSLAGNQNPMETTRLRQTQVRSYMHTPVYIRANTTSVNRTPHSY